MPTCNLCTFQSEDRVDFTRHVVRSHRNNPAFRVQCQFCNVTYSKWNSFRSHLQRKHSGEVPPADLQEVLNDDAPVVEPPDIESVNAEEGEVEPEAGQGLCSEEVHRLKAAKFLLNMRESGNITQRAVDLLVDGVDNVINSHLDQIQAKLMDARENPNDPSVPVDIVNRIFQEAKESSAFEGVHSKYFLDKFLKREGAVSAEEVFLGEYPKTNPPRIVYKKAHAYLIPLESSLNQIFPGESEVCTRVLI